MIPEPICMNCSRECKKWEIVNDGLQDEVWCWCDICQVDTFNKIENEIS